MQRLYPIVACLFPPYLIHLILGSYSLVGYWPDVWLTLILAWLTFNSFAHIKTTQHRRKWACLKVINGFCLLVTLLLFLNPLNVLKFDLDVSTHHMIQGQRYHGYYQPGGAFIRSTRFYITQSPRWMPFLEKRIVYQSRIQEDLSEALWGTDDFRSNMHDLILLYLPS